jgi:hypothetical protein
VLQELVQDFGFPFGVLSVEINKILEFLVMLAANNYTLNL